MVALAIGVVVGVSYAVLGDRLPFVKSGATACSEDPIRPVSNGFISPDNSGTIPEFETIFSISNQGADRGYVDSSGESNVWVANSKLAYIVTYFKNNNVSEDVVYYDGQEVDRSLLYGFSPLQKITDRLAYYGKDKIVFGDKTFPFPQLNSVSLEDTQAIDGKLFIRGSGGGYYNGEKIDEEKDYIFAINGSMAKFKTQNLGTTTVTYQGQTADIQKKKNTFIYKDKEYGTEYDGFAGQTVALCNNKPVYAVQEGSSILDENYQQYVIYKGKVIGGPYRSVGKIGVVGGDIVFLATKGKRVAGEQYKAVLVKNGTEISEQFDTVNDFFSHNGHLVFIGVDTETIESPTRSSNGLEFHSSEPVNIYYVVEDGQVIYKTGPNEQIFTGDARSNEVTPVGDKLAILVRDYSTSESKVLYDGKEVLQEYVGAVSKIFDLNGKLGALVADRDGSALVSSIVIEGLRSKLAPVQSPEQTQTKSPVQERFDVLSKGTALEGRILVATDNDYLDGGPGEDTTLYSGQRAAYELYRGKDSPEYNAYNTFFVIDKRNGSIDTLVNVERVDFADQVISLPGQTVITTRAVPVGSATMSLHFKERGAIQNASGRTASVILAYMTSTAVSFVVIFESATQKLLSIPVGGSDMVVLTDDINGPRLSVSVTSAQSDLVTVNLQMLP